jgi:hypothetical protein
MKMKHALCYLAFGYCLDFVGVLLKIEHLENADNFLIAGTVFKVVGVLLVMIKSLTHPKAKDVLNW